MNADNNHKVELRDTVGIVNRENIPNIVHLVTGKCPEIAPQIRHHQDFPKRATYLQSQFKGQPAHAVVLVVAIDLGHDVTILHELYLELKKCMLYFLNNFYNLILFICLLFVIHF